MAVVCVIAAARSAQADGDGARLFAESLGERLRGKRIPVSGVLFAVGPGWEFPKRLTLHADVGYAWGIDDTGFLGGTHVSHVTVAPSISFADTDDAAYGVALSYGIAGQGIVSGGYAGGVEARFADVVSVGPVGTLRLGYGFTVLFVQLGAHIGRDDVDLNLRAGIEVLRLPTTTREQNF